jgi:RimJ/RimL family protein N-acetyltransferase
LIVAGEQVAKFVSERLGFGLCPPYSAMGIERDGEIVGGVLFNHFEGADVHVTIAGEGWNPGFMRAVGHYVFNQLDCERMTAVTEQPAICKIAKRMGGVIEGTMRNHFGRGRDGILIGILRDSYRFGSFSRE